MVVSPTEYQSWSLALGLLYQVDIGQTTLHDAIETDISLSSADPVVQEAARTLAAGVSHLRRKIDRSLKVFAPTYEIARIPAVERNILRLGISCLAQESNLPFPAIVTLARHLADEFGGPASARFVHAVLKAAHTASTDGSLAVLMETIPMAEPAVKTTDPSNIRRRPSSSTVPVQRNSERRGPERNNASADRPTDDRRNHKESERYGRNHERSAPRSESPRDYSRRRPQDSPSGPSSERPPYRQRPSSAGTNERKPTTGRSGDTQANRSRPPQASRPSNQHGRRLKNEEQPGWHPDR